MDEHKRAAARKHESEDVNVQVISRLALAAAAALVVVAIGIYSFYRHFEAMHPKVRTEIWASQISAAFPEPRLQTAPGTDVAAFNAEKQRMLREYAWIDEGKGVARIPIDRAIELLAQRKHAGDR